jgi:hypothetical protein
VQAESLRSLAASAEWGILVECASARPETPRLGDLLRNPDWNGLLELAEEHGVISLLAARLRTYDDAVVPAAFRQQLLGAQRSHVLSALSLVVEMIRILDRFRAAGVQALVLKGPALSLQAYGDATARQFGDVDLLVRHNDIHRAAKIIMDSGFDAKIPQDAVAAGKIPGEYFFSRPGTNVILEVHTERTLRYFPKRLPIEKLFRHQARLNFDGHEVPTLSAEDALVSMCTHGAKHFWERLMWIADVAAMIARQEIGWDVAEETAKSLGARRIVHTGLLLATELLGAPLPASVEDGARKDRGARALANRIKTWLPAAGEASPGLLGRALFRARMRGGFWPGIRYLTRLSLAPTEEDWSAGHEHKNSRFRESARRLVRLAGKYGRNPNR